MEDTSQEETYDKTAPPGPTPSIKAPKYYKYPDRRRKLIEGPNGELTRIFGIRIFQV